MVFRKALVKFALRFSGFDTFLEFNVITLVAIFVNTTLLAEALVKHLAFKVSVFEGGFMGVGTLHVVEFHLAGQACFILVKETTDAEKFCNILATFGFHGEVVLNLGQLIIAQKLGATNLIHDASFISIIFCVSEAFLAREEDVELVKFILMEKFVLVDLVESEHQVAVIGGFLNRVGIVD